MATTNVLLEHLREGSATAKLYTLLKDNKVHSLKTVKAALVKMGIKPNRTRALIFRFCRIARNYTDMQINSSKRTDTIQLVKRDKAAAARAAIAKAKGLAATKVAPAKAVKKVVKAKAKPASKSAVAVMEDDDAVLEA